MLITGAGGHAKELLNVLLNNGYENDIFFYDGTSNREKLFFNKWRIISDWNVIREIFLHDNKFCIGVGSPGLRLKLSQEMINLGGELISVISSSSSISTLNVGLSDGLNIMHNVMISTDVKIGRGTLINASSSIHHDVVIGEYCEISPGVTLLGNVTVGANTSIGSKSTVLPKLTIGSNVIIGAGAVIIRDIPDNSLVMGVPGVIKNSMFL
jgi:sugar O-acyltransferase (sialic acid O-acetyltransferase NeuD family)